MTEAALQQKVIRKLRALWPNVLIVNKSPSPFDKRGISDLLVALPHPQCVFPVFIPIELKRPGLNAEKELTEPQIAFLNKAVKAGCPRIVASSWEEIIDVLTRLGFNTGVNGSLSAA
ncbi:MAG: hypothetical protein KGL39_36625 [Patescibacteria group bacterium]|nr:hypothetical protein [Patescibacteria group bacterium]